MTIPRVPRPKDTPGNPEAQIAELVRVFQENPYDFFCEPELHAKFYSLCRDKFPTFPTPDGKRVAAFRCQYGTVWRYQAGDRFAERSRNRGSTSTFDFVVLRHSFIFRSTFLKILNKDEQTRSELRPPLELEPRYKSEPVQHAIELKLAAIAGTLEVSEG